ncbi:MAG TPA: HAD hydrolase family protein [Phycisphaerae bacterium]
MTRLSVLALDYDGTIAESGRLSDEVRAAIADVRSRGIMVILVTGRILRDLVALVGDLSVCDAVVGENGAVVTFPDSGRTLVLAPPAHPDFVGEVRHRGIPIEAGECVIEADAAEAPRILPVIRELELPLVILFNRGRLMVLPQAVSKATGLRAALTALRLSEHNTMAIGDAENDHELLACCEVGVAVGWGSPALKSSADLVLEGRGPDAVAEFIRNAAARCQLPPGDPRRHRLLLGTCEDGQPLWLAVKGRNVLVSGDAQSGKSWIAGLLAEQLILQRYCVLVIDPEGEYSSLEALPGVIVFGGEATKPRLAELARVLRHHDVSIVADLSGLSYENKPRYVNLLLHLVAAHRRLTGLPHRVVLDEAHYFLDDSKLIELLALESGGYTLVTHRPSLLRPEVLATSEAIILTRETGPHEVEGLFKAHGSAGTLEQWQAALAALKVGEAVLPPDTEEARGFFCKLKIAPRMTPHARHRRKYLEWPVPAGREFQFTRDHRATPFRARTMREFVACLSAIPNDVLDGHLRRGDFSRWIDDVFAEHHLATQVAELESQYRVTRGAAMRGTLARVIEESSLRPARRDTRRANRDS